MSNVGKVIFNLLSNDADVGAIVSNSGAYDIFPLRASNKANDTYITYQEIDLQPNQTDNRVSGMDFIEMQINCYSSSYDTAADLAEKVRTVLDQYVGIVESVDVREVEFQDRNTLYDEELEKAGIALDFVFSVKR